MVELNPILEKEGVVAHGASFKVFGIGGAGCNAVNSMVASQEFTHVEFIVANTDAQSLHLSQVKKKIQMGSKITKGLGAGSNPDTGRRAAEEDLDTIIEQLAGTDILFLTAGFGGGTGSGGLPVVASAARELGILTVAIVTKPFLFEGKRRQRFADEAINGIKNKVDTLIVVPNQRLLEIADPKISMLDAFALSNSILKNAVKGISDIITKSGHINVDFADVKAIMKDMGMAMMGTGSATGPDRARQAALNAINSPLLENVSIRGAKGVLINITGNKDLGLQEINDAAMLVYDLVSDDANIILGSVIDNNLTDEVVVTVIATGFDTLSSEIHVITQPAKNSEKFSGSTKEVDFKKEPELKEPKRVTVNHELLLTHDKTLVPTVAFKTDLEEKKQISQASEPTISFSVSCSEEPVSCIEQEVTKLVEATHVVAEETLLEAEAQVDTNIAPEEKELYAVLSCDQKVDQAVEQAVSCVQSATVTSEGPLLGQSKSDLDLTSLDTPAFLRKQAQQQSGSVA